ncbi:hypothetical protein JD844_028438 [Phrynosoma platyrhinos]|uniref:Apolipoprotein L6 n=1 Tax=Phrynosoma platyrhinos TaxID=52577 RepID=A0ABQ7SHZ2_PHRPL|nr:hypothetical protein JD844_028438 [Phrynosoma platyrhinos]
MLVFSREHGNGLENAAHWPTQTFVLCFILIYNRNGENGPLEEQGDEKFARIWKILSGNEEEAEKCICCLQEEIKKAIQDLHEIADSTEIIDKGLMASDIVSGVLNATSSIVVILGIFLAPVAVGPSLTLALTGLGLAGLAAATRDFISVYGEFNSKKKDKANELMKNCAESVKNSKEKLKSLGSSFYPETEDIMEKIIDSNIADQASNISKAVKIKFTRKISVHVQKMKEELKEIPLAKSTGGKVTNGILTFLEEICTIVENIKTLTKGAKGKSAAEIREMANKLEDMWLKFDQVRKKLQEQQKPEKE